jgi:hypothetical protein
MSQVVEKFWITISQTRLDYPFRDWKAEFRRKAITETLNVTKSFM